VSGLSARFRRYSPKPKKPKKETAVLKLRDILRSEVSDRKLKALDARAGLIMFLASAAIAFISVIASFNLIPSDLLPLILSVLLVVLLATNIPYRLAEIADSIELRIRSLQFLYYVGAGFAFYTALLSAILLLVLFPPLYPILYLALPILAVIFFLVAFPKQLGYHIWEELAPEHPDHTLAANYLSMEAFPAGLSVASLLWSIPITLLFGLFIGLSTIAGSGVIAMLYLWTRRSREEIAQRYLGSLNLVSRP
jgi:hypothetical protein